ncbi:solute carrier family 2, facilitated glucose transporter member 2-like isoform X3 [Vanessa atalanta]|uniref:solute carrier family 2, facilitated glucose transporter member 2-like isoform X3 n=1 Tax=Vanessa atalanta TaxID=42275 RepID=UPI001FCDEEC6|nr:solute carrier family 2, facilitated glucose transporter member 2-like isoform X3 [Vanessa atalanta]
MGEQRESSSLFTNSEPISNGERSDTSTLVANEQQHLTQTHEFKPGWSFYLVLAGVTTTFGSSLPVGFNIGVVNSPAEIIKTFCNESFISRYDLPLDKTWLNVLWSSIVSIFIVGGCTGSILGSCFADKFGRKYATIITNLLSIAGAILFLFCRAANSVEMLILGRLLVGLSGGLTTSIVPMYLTELSPPRLSGAMGVACPIGVNAGVLVGQVMGLDVILGGVDNWPYLLSVFALLVIISLPILFILPESPKYLFVVKRNEPAAIKELSRLRGEIPSVLTEDLELLREEVQAEASTSGEKWGMWRVAREPKLRLPLLLACTMQAGQQTSGINADAMPWMPYVCMAAVILYVLVFGFGLGPIPYFIASELFEVSSRAGGMAWGSLCNWGGNFLVGMSFPTLRDFVGAGSFLLFSALTAALFFFQRSYFPETKGKTPTQVAQLCSRGLKSRPLNSRHQGDA